MARLIDADKLIENINEIYKGYMLDECGCVPYHFENIVDEQPTAYDIDKVVEEIKDNYGCGNCEQSNSLSCNECYESEMIDGIIDIVKEGGKK